MITNRATLKKCIVFIHLFLFNYDTNVQKSAITSHKKRLITSISLNLRSWCLHAESNYELILTMDPLYHLTMEAIAR